MSNSDENLPPQTSKFFDIIPASKRSASPTSRPLIVDNTPTQTDSMINSDQQPDLAEIPSDQSHEEEAASVESSEVAENLSDQNVAEASVDAEPSSSAEDASPVQTDVEEVSQEESVPSTETDITPASDEENPPPVQTDIEPMATLDQPTEDELLLPAHASPDEAPAPEAVVIHSPGNSKFFRLKTWLIVVLFVVIIAIIGTLLYLYVFKSTATNTPQVQFFGS